MDSRISALVTVIVVSIVPRFALSQPSTTLPYGPAGGFTAVLNEYPSWLSIVDNRSRAVVRVMRTHRADDSAAMNVELAPSGRVAYVLHADNAITRLDLTDPTSEPEFISPLPSTIFPGSMQLMRDFEISDDGNYLVATAVNAGAWQSQSPIPRNRISIYDLKAGSSMHFTLDTTLNNLFLPELEILIDSQNRAYVTDGDFQAVVVVDLPTGAILGTYKGSDNDSSSTPVGGSGPGPALPCGAITRSKFGPTWIAFHTSKGAGVLRRPGAALGAYIDTSYPGPDLREVEARINGRFVALSRPKSISLTQTAVDRISVVDLTTGASCITDAVTGSHRFREIEFFRDGADARVYGIDFAANAFLLADFSPWVANPAITSIALSSTPIPNSVFRFRQGSDGLLADYGEYIVHDAEGRLAYIGIDPPSLRATVDTHLFPGIRKSVDLELSTGTASHQD